MASNDNREAKAPAYKSGLFIITGGNLKFQTQKDQLVAWPLGHGPYQPPRG